MKQEREVKDQGKKGARGEKRVLGPLSWKRFQRNRAVAVITSYRMVYVTGLPVSGPSEGGKRPSQAPVGGGGVY